MVILLYWNSHHWHSHHGLHFIYGTQPAVDLGQSAKSRMIFKRCVQGCPLVAHNLMEAVGGERPHGTGGVGDARDIPCRIVRKCDRTRTSCMWFTDLANPVPIH